ncbi:hypothetical protein AUJ83_00605 [Candidatus Woesearchaeota archaeon CG1_02_33_12]|nr:MAG: hypothetical protein AUJ83_00605 [Candidatus Woesearchaeota archaeon CG1_02_33_12]
MKIMSKLKELLNEGEGHVIWKIKPVLKALEESDFEIELKDDYFEIKSNSKKCILNITGAPNKPPESKYDIWEWIGTQDDTGIWDLDLMRTIVVLTGKEYTGANCIGRGFQYRSYMDWLIKEGYIKEKECVV